MTNPAGGGTPLASSAASLAPKSPRPSLPTKLPIDGTSPERSGHAKSQTKLKCTTPAKDGTTDRRSANLRRLAPTSDQKIGASVGLARNARWVRGRSYLVRISHLGSSFSLQTGNANEKWDAKNGRIEKAGRSRFAVPTLMQPFCLHILIFRSDSKLKSWRELKTASFK